MMTETDIAFALLRSAIDGSVPKLEQIETNMWWSVFRLVQRHHVVALTYDVAVRCEVPRAVLMPWLSEREKAIGWHRYQLKVQQDIVDTMRQNNIPVTVLKGTHTAQYYPQAEMREFGDLDLYFGDRHAAADEVARRKLNVTVDVTPHHHTKYDYRGVTVESHFEFFNRYYPGSNKRYNQMLASMGASQTFDVLHFLRHAAIHFAAQRLSLRDLCDWAFIVANGKEVDWRTVETEMKRFGMSMFAATLDGITHSRLGIASTMYKGTPSDYLIPMENDIFHGKQSDNTPSQYLHSRWKRRLAFGDSEPSLLLHKAISRLTHKTK